MTRLTKHYIFKEWLLQEMAKREWSQADLARHANLNRAVVNKLLNGHSSTPRPSTIAALARAFKLPVEQLYRVTGLLPEISEENKFTEEASYNLNKIKDPKRKITALSLIKALIAEEEE